MLGGDHHHFHSIHMSIGHCSIRVWTESVRDAAARHRGKSKRNADRLQHGNQLASEKLG